MENKGQRYISMRWVIKEKIKDGKVYIKMMLIVRGFEEIHQTFKVT